jgi:hypothetical protein
VARHAIMIVVGFERDIHRRAPGSTVNQVICRAPVPVLAVPSPAD